MIKFFPNDQTIVLFNIGGFTLDIRWYAFLILSGAFLAYYFIKRDIKKLKYVDLDFFDSLFIYTLWFGILGARLWYCVFYNFKFYFSNPVQIIRIWDGGLAIQGGLVFGAIFAYLYVKKNNYSFMKLADIILPNVLLAQAVGRWGNFVNKECHGAEVSEEYFNGILSFLKEGMYIDGHYYEPLFFYESILCLIGWALIYFVLKKRQNKRGDLVYAYLMWYGVIRFFIEQKRTDSLYIGNLKMAQVTSVIFLIVGLLGYFGFFEKYIKYKKPTLFFDFDGTLMDTSAIIYEGYKRLFEKYSDISKFNDEVQSEIYGPALRVLFPKYFPGVDYDTLYADYKARQLEVYGQIKPMENVEETLKTLHEDGYHMAIVSTRSHEGISELLDKFDLLKYFDGICGVNDVEKVKPDPEGIFKVVNEKKLNRECVMIGDSLMDIECGKNYGAYTIGYISMESRTEVLKENADVTITDFKDLLDILKNNFTYK